ncbi:MULTISPECIES: BfmA/BtgA family mobilization protein [Flavobacteriaceae]|uniref:Uncharacterized protein n=2 Tax=Flavobacteriaceae TaxID=49546 RepID=A0A2T0MB33_9FLAO|nr:BfmA/BtgA family mobilization protein [Allomuricauda pacifica]PRX54675.1 hypothetical protein CLV81_3078 [Allomuricauda pacifica]
MDSFTAIRFKKDTAQKFKQYSKHIAPTHTQAMAMMLDFFERNHCTPDEDYGPHLIRLERRVLKRIDSLIAIIKNIEKTQTKPTHAMLAALFQAYEPPKQKLMIEKNDPYLNTEVRFREKKYSNDKDEN